MAKKVKRAWYTQIVSGDTMTGIVENTSQTIDGVTDEWKTLTESGLKTLQYTLRNDPEALQNIYNKYALPEQYSGLKALV